MQQISSSVMWFLCKLSEGKSCLFQRKWLVWIQPTHFQPSGDVNQYVFHTSQGVFRMQFCEDRASFCLM